MASTSERILIDVELNLQKSERSIDQFVSKARTAVQQANLSNVPAGQSVKPAGPAAIGLQTGQVVNQIRGQGAALGYDQAQIREATRLAQQQGRQELERYISERGLGGKGADTARGKYDDTYAKTRRAYQAAELENKRQEVAASAQSAEHSRRKAASDQKGAVEAEQQNAQQSALEKTDTANRTRSVTATGKQAASDTAQAAASTAQGALFQRLTLGKDARKVFDEKLARSYARRDANLALNQTPEYIQSQTDAQVYDTRTRQLVRAKTTETLASDSGYIAATNRVNTARRQVATAEIQGTLQSKSAIRVLAELTGNRRLLAAATKRELERSIRDGTFSGTKFLTPFQRLTAGIGYGGGGGAGGGGGGGGLGLTGGEFFGSGLLSVLRYSVPSLALFGAGRAAISGFKEAEELEKQFNLIESQYDAVFGADGQSKAEGFKQKILEIAAETGQAAEQVASVGYQFTGAFQTETIGDKTGQALVDSQLEAATKLSRVTGLTIDEITDPLTAASLAFDAPIEKIGDTVLTLQDQFGVLAPEIIGFLGDIAPVAKDAGLSLEEIGTIGAITQQQSGRSGTALAEAYGRVIPAITEAKTELIELAARNDALGDDFLAAVAQGNVDEQFLTLAKVFEELDSSSQDFVINLLGGRREAQSILAAFNSSDTLEETIAALEDGKGIGTLEERFSKLQETLGQTVARLGEQFRQLFVALYDSGLKDAFESLADVAGYAVGGLTTFFNIFKRINEATDGWVVKLGTLVTTFVLLRRAVQAIGRSKLYEQIAAGVTSLASRGQAVDPLAGSAYARGPYVPVPGSRGPLLTRNGAANIGTGAALGIGALGATLVFEKFTSDRGELKALENDLAERMKDYSTERLEQIAEQTTSFWDRGYAALTGVVLPNQLATFELAAQKSETYGKYAGIVADDDLANIVADVNEQQLEDLNNFIFSGPNASYLDDTNLDDFASGGGYDPKTFQILPRGFTREDVNQEFIQEVFKQAEEAEGQQQVWAQSIADILWGWAANDPELQAALLQANQDEARGKVLSEAEAKAEEVTKTLEELAAQYEAGDIGLQEYLDGFDRNIGELRKSLAIAYDPTLAKSLAKLVKDKGKVYSDAAAAQEAQAAEIATLAGGETDATLQARTESLTGLLNDPQFTDPDARSKTAKTLVDVYRKQLDEQISAADSAEEAAQIAREGITLDPAARSALIIAQLNANNVAFTELTRRLGDGLGENSAATVQAIFAAIATGDQALIDMYRADLIAKINALNAEIEAEEQRKGPFRKNIFDLGRQLEASAKRRERDAAFQVLATLNEGNLDAYGVVDPGNKVSDANKALEEQKKADEERAKELKAQREARYEVQKALAEDDPIAQAVIDIAIANDRFNAAETDSERISAFAEKIRAQNALRKAQEQKALEEYEARIDVAKAMAEGDPIKTAQIAIFEAAAEFNRAKTDAERIKALAARIRAERGLQDAIYDVFNSQIELAKAMAESVQDTVKVAEIGVFEAAANLNRVLAQSPQDQAAQNRARAQLVSAQTNLADTRISKQLEDYQYLYDMEQITKEQYINYLTALRSTLDPVTQQQQFRDISRTIKQLKGDLAQDLQFNLPTSINLPTLYEARRLNQSVGPDGAQIGYQDNRNVTVSLYITNGMTQQEAVNLLNAALGTNTVGYGGRRY